jgi:hypothetical protein
MSKKTHPKKMVTIKLESGHSFFATDIELILNIQRTYADMLRTAKTEEDRLVFTKILEAVQESIENVYYAPTEGVDDEW